MRAGFLIGTACISFIIIMAYSNRPAHAVRPFITDDARVTPSHTFLTEGSLRIDENKFLNLMLFALGITNKLESTVGFTDGFLRTDDKSYSFTGPIIQLKYLFIDQTGLIPAIATAIGIIFPWSVGDRDFAPTYYSKFGYVALSYSISSHPERLNLHLNIGSTMIHDRNEGLVNDPTWGVGIQFVIISDIIFGIAEIASADPYGVSAGSVYQLGCRIFISDQMQLDATYGAEAWGNPRPGWFAGCGLRYLTM